MHSLDTKRGGGRLASGFIDTLQRTRKISVRALTSLSSGSAHEEAIISSNPLCLLRSAWRIRKVLRQADIIHAFDVFPYGMLAVFFTIGLKKKVIITAIGSGSIQPLFDRHIAFLARYAYRHANVCTAISSYVAREIQKHVPDLKISIVIPGIDYAYFAKKGDIRTSLCPKPFILSVAKVKPRKGVDTSLRAFAKIAPEFPLLKFVIVGVCEGSYCDSIKALSDTLGITERVMFVQRISDDDLRALYENAKVFVLLPQNIQNDIEGFGLVFLEAAALGVPVIGARESGAEDAVLDGKNGYLVAPADADDTADKMRKILSDPILRRQFSRESIEFAKRCDWSNIIKSYHKMYELLLGHTI